MKAQSHQVPSPTPFPVGESRRNGLASFLIGVFGLIIVGGTPILLWKLVGNPLRRLPTSFEQLQGYVDQRYLPVTVLVGVLAIILWVLWLQYVWALLWEVAVVGPQAARGTIARSAPLAPRFVRSMASIVISGVLATNFAAITPSLTAISAQMVSAPVALAPDGAQQGDVAQSLSQSGMPIHVVAQGESLWSLSGRDDVMLRKLLDLNDDQIRTPLDLRPGMQLVLPPELAAANPQFSAAQAGSTGAVDNHVVVDDHHIVVEGDNLWTIASNRLELKGDTAPSNAEIATEVQEMVELNTDSIVDPDLIYPQDLIELPEGLQLSRSTTPTQTPAPPSPVDSSRQPQAPVVAGAVNGVNGSSSVSDVGTSQAPIGRGLTTGLVATTAAFMVLSRLRRRRADRLGAARVRAELADGDLAGRLAAGSDVEFLAWAATRLSALRETLERRPMPLAVCLATKTSNGGGIALLWDNHEPEPMPGWEISDNGEWFAPYNEMTPVDLDLPAPAVPGLITIGTVDNRGADPILLNFEAIGSLAVGGTPDQISEAARSIVFEAVAGPLLSNMSVTIATDVYGGLAEGLNGAVHLLEDQAIRRAEVVGEEAVRANRVELFVIDAVSPLLNRWLQLAQPGSGIALLVCGEVASLRIGAHLTISPDGHAVLLPFGMSVEVCGLTSTEVIDFARLVNQVTTDPEAEVAVVRSPEQVIADRPAHLADPADIAQLVGPAALTGAETIGGEQPLLIRVLGPVRCDDRPSLTSRPLSFVAYLAVQPNRQATRQELMKNVWGARGVTDKQFDLVVSVAQSHLGLDRIPQPATPDEPIRLVGVETDLDRVQVIVDQASNTPAQHAASLLEGATEYIRGPVFDGVVREWALAAGYTAWAEELVESIAIRAAELLIDLGRYDEARTVLANGLRALPANEPIHRTYMNLASDLGMVGVVASTMEQLQVRQEILSPNSPPAVSAETERLARELLSTSSRPTSSAR